MSKPIVIRPVINLSKKGNGIEKLCIEKDLPVFITKNGSNHLVIMSHGHFEKIQEQLALYERILVAESENRRQELRDFDD